MLFLQQHKLELNRKLISIYSCSLHMLKMYNTHFKKFHNVLTSCTNPVSVVENQDLYFVKLFLSIVRVINTILFSLHTQQIFFNIFTLVQLISVCEVCGSSKYLLFQIKIYVCCEIKKLI